MIAVPAALPNWAEAVRMDPTVAAMWDGVTAKSAMLAHGTRLRSNQEASGEIDTYFVVPYTIVVPAVPRQNPGKAKGQ